MLQYIVKRLLLMIPTVLGAAFVEDSRCVAALDWDDDGREDLLVKSRTAHFFHVGDSRGVGGTAIWVEGVAWPAGKYDSYEVLESGGDTVSFTLQYAWDTPLGAVTESKTFTLELGKQLYRVDSVFTLDGAPASLPIAIGLTTHDEKAQVSGSGELGRISTSEVIDDSSVWTGALMDPARTLEVVHVPSEDKDASHIWLLTNTTEQGELSFRAGFAWEAAQDIASFEQWNEYLDSRAGL